MTSTPAISKLNYLSAARAAIASGVIGVLAVASLIGYLIFRNPNYDLGILMERFHDVGVILQFLLLIPVAFGFYRLSHKLPHPISRYALNIGVGSLLLTSLCLLLIFFKITSDILYMFPQGAFGVWLIYVNIKLKRILSTALRWFGIIVGFGLALVGLFIICYVIFVSTAPLWIPVAPQEVQEKIPITSVNIFLHNYPLNIGSLLGVLMLPFWTVLSGISLQRKKYLSQSV